MPIIVNLDVMMAKRKAYWNTGRKSEIKPNAETQKRKEFEHKDTEAQRFIFSRGRKELPLCLCVQ